MTPCRLQYTGAEVHEKYVATIFSVVPIRGVSLEKELSQFDTKSVIDVSMNKAQKKIT
jgi:hypothetical protein